MEPQAETETVTVYIYEYLDGQARVEPGRVVVPRGGTVVWENLTDDEVQIHFPEPELFDPPTKSLSFSATCKPQSLTVASGASRGGHPYGGVRHGPGRLPELLVGGSTPVMIVR
ncbi:MAG: hypothetical protein EA351_07900 [Gemmatimonadales bacterium]|nr:MAG: hypothetical protein EA351_07900 [Gemmatimonadales bacterium]